MPKINIKRLDSTTANDVTATKTINDNFKALQEGIDDSLSRTGKVPNYMDADFDLNHYRIINVADPVEDRDAVTLKYLKETLGDAKHFADKAEQQANRAEKAADGASKYLQQVVEAKDVANNAAIRSEESAIAANNAAIRSEESANKVLNAAPLTFTDLYIPSSEWFEDFLLSPDFLYSVYVPLEGVKESMIPFVTFPAHISVTGLLAPVAITVEGGLYIYAKEIPQDFTIPSIVCIPTAADVPSLPDIPVIPGIGQYEIDYDNVTIVNDTGVLSILQNDNGSYTVLEGFTNTSGFWFNAAPMFGIDDSLSYTFKFRLNSTTDLNKLNSVVALGNYQDESASNKISFMDMGDGFFAVFLYGSSEFPYACARFSAEANVGQWITIETKKNEDGYWQFFVDGNWDTNEFFTDNQDAVEDKTINFPINYYLNFVSKSEEVLPISVDLEEVGFKSLGEWTYRAAKEIL